MNLSNIVLLLGGVSLFLFGMKLMGDGLKSVAGNKLEVFLYRLSGTPVKGILLGTGVTAVIQSSSAVSIMAVGFVNSSMMKVKQAISVIMGAIIGTSVTGWIISLSQIGGSSQALSLLSTESISAFVAIVGMVMQLVGRKSSTKKVGGILLGFAVLMFGIKTMSQSVDGLKTNQSFINLLTSFQHPIFGMLAGLICTAILQSASAAVGILQALSTTGALTFNAVLPIILGIALGASVPVMLSAIESTTNGKRTAYSYPVIEVFRVVLFAIFFYGFNAIFKFSFTSKTVSMVDIAFINTFFRFVTVAVLAPFTGLIESVVTDLVPGNSDESSVGNIEIKHLESRFLAYPPLAVEQSRLAINNMAEDTKLNIQIALNLLFNYSDQKYNDAVKLENAVDKYEDSIGTYLMQLTGKEMTKEQSLATSKYLHALTDLERISDHALNIADSAKEINEKKIDFSDEGVKDINLIKSAITEVVETTIRSLSEDNIDWARRVEPLEQTIDALCDKLKDNHINRLQKGLCTFEHSYVFNDLLTNFERISDHCSNIALAIIELKDNTLASHEYGNKIKDSDKVFSEYFEEFKKKYNV